MLLNWELNIAMSGSFRTKFTCYSGFQTQQQRIYAFSNDQEHPHDQRLLESVIKRETSVVGGKNPSLQILLFGTNPLNKQHYGHHLLNLGLYRAIGTL